MKHFHDVFLEKYSDYIHDLRIELKKPYRHPPFKNAAGNDLYRITRSIIKNNGKLLRSLLTLLSCEVLSGNYKAAIPVAVSYELAHNASLVQDDIIDQSPLRRGKPSINFKYGTSTALLTANLFIFQIYNFIAGYKQSDISKKEICQILDMIGDCGKEATLGEYFDEKSTGQINLSEKDYFLLIKLKTGKLFAASSACGAIAGKGSAKDIETMYRTGENMGIAFQIYDDILNLVGRERILKKPVFSDLENGKQNLVIIRAYKNSSGPERKFINRIFGKRRITLAHKKEFSKIILKTGAVEYSKKKCAQYMACAQDYLGKIKNGRPEAKKKIMDMADFIIKRNI